MLTEVGEGFRNFTTDVPRLPCSLLSFATKGRHHITSSECMKEQYSTRSLRPDSFCNVMNWNPSKIGSLSKGNSHLLKAKLLQGWQNRYCYYKDVCVICLDNERLATIYCCVLGMEKNLCISLFMAA